MNFQTSNQPDRETFTENFPKDDLDKITEVAGRFGIQVQEIAKAGSQYPVDEPDLRYRFVPPGNVRVRFDLPGVETYQKFLAAYREEATDELKARWAQEGVQRLEIDELLRAAGS